MGGCSVVLFSVVDNRRCAQVSTGAQNDLQKITQMAYQSVAVYGMNDKVGLVSFPQDNQRMDKPYSDETARVIDEEARKIIAECYDATLGLLRDKTDVVEALAQVHTFPPSFWKLWVFLGTWLLRLICAGDWSSRARVVCGSLPVVWLSLIHI